MTRAGIRELKQNASALIRRVVAGETIEITDRGRPIARIVPLRGTGVLDQLIAEGRATAAEGDLLGIKPVRRQPGSPSLSAILREMRADER